MLPRPFPALIRCRATATGQPRAHGRLGVLVALALAFAATSRAGAAVERVVPSPDWPDLATAIAASEDGDAIRLLAGRFTGSGNTSLAPITRSITIRGAGAKASVIDGEGDASLLRIESAAVVLEDLALVNGRATAGGAIRLSGTDASLLATRIRIADCAATVSGGAIQAFGGDVTIMDSILEGNRAPRGAALSLGAAATGDVVGTSVIGHDAGDATSFGSILEATSGAALTVRSSSVAESTTSSIFGAIGLADAGVLTLVDVGTTGLRSPNADVLIARGTGALARFDGGLVDPNLLGLVRVLVDGAAEIRGEPGTTDGSPLPPLVGGLGSSVRITDFRGEVRRFGVDVRDVFEIVDSDVVFADGLSMPGGMTITGRGAVRLSAVRLEAQDAELSFDGSPIGGGTDRSPRLLIDEASRIEGTTARLNAFGHDRHELSDVVFDLERLTAELHSGPDGVGIADVTFDAVSSFDSILRLRSEGAATIDRLRMLGCRAGRISPPPLDSSPRSPLVLGPVTGGVVIDDARFVGNSTGASGGAILVTGSTDVRIQRSVFAGNEAEVSGGAIAIRQDPVLGGGTVTLLASRFTGHTAARGGAIRVDGPDAHLDAASVAFAGNAATTIGGAVLVSRGASADLRFVTMAGGVSPAGTAFAVDGIGASATLTGSILAGDDDGAPIWVSPDGTLDATDSIVTGGWPGAGIRDLDPRFRDAAAGDLRLRPCSPAVDAGPSPALPADAADLDGDGDVTEALPLDARVGPRILDDPAVPDTGTPLPGDPAAAVVDLGALERAAGGCDADLDASGTVDLDDLLAVLAAWDDPTALDADLTCDGGVGLDDLLVVLAAWATSCDPGADP